ncbi:unnamed protein product [Bursaphelenchus xylophilus]|uniref:(pine wood nematode) hypothetical protein n=1 Tax=Bursaphelenchus xylophilus TaxID=6326 RepID=A0A1I7SQN8_BURXY|nr:unnamed protein product [Bursaphelenchus xylophilus]CAG9110158.1 unnamed protein product [Bursaphelenchus xylophilus]
MTSKAIKTILMCRPTYFQVRYSINPWMKLNQPVDVPKAQSQWNTLKDEIEKAGGVVKVMEPHGAEQFPDLVFTANAATVRNKTAYLANFFYPERQGERYFYGKWFSDNGYVTTGSLDIPFEGTGDALWAGSKRDKLICGVGPRTDVKALDEVHKALNVDGNTPFKTVGMRLVDPRFYHIDTALCPLNDDLGIYYPYAFDPISRHNLKNELELIPVSQDDAARFACNAVVVGKTVIIHEGSELIARDLERVGYTTVFVNMSEFLKSGGSCKCCTLEI